MAPASIELRSTAFLASGLVGLLAALLAFLLPGKNRNSTDPLPAGQAGGTFIRNALPFSLLALLAGACRSGSPTASSPRVPGPTVSPLGPCSARCCCWSVLWIGSVGSGGSARRCCWRCWPVFRLPSSSRWPTTSAPTGACSATITGSWAGGAGAQARHGHHHAVAALQLCGRVFAGFAYNAQYAPDFDGEDAPYWFVNGFRALGSSILPGLQPGLPIEDGFRNVTFRGNTSNSLVVAYNKAHGCLRVLDPVYRLAPPNREREPAPAGFQPRAGPSRRSQPYPVVIFGPEPDRGWCYFFQKADLARQMQDWESGVWLAEEASRQGLAPVSGVERLPFIEAYAHAGQWDAALDQTRLAAQQTRELEPFLCDAWLRLENATRDSEGRREAIASIESQFKCSAIQAGTAD